MPAHFMASAVACTGRSHVVGMHTAAAIYDVRSMEGPCLHFMASAVACTGRSHILSMHISWPQQPGGRARGECALQPQGLDVSHLASTYSPCRALAQGEHAPCSYNW